MFSNLTYARLNVSLCIRRTRVQVELDWRDQFFWCFRSRSRGLVNERELETEIFEMLMRWYHYHLFIPRHKMISNITPVAPGQCTPLNLSDDKPCEESATSSSGLFWYFHSRQCYELYLGYKRRNLRLDRLSESTPKYLLDHSDNPLVKELFSDVDKKETWKEIHDHLFQKLQLLDRVIGARSCTIASSMLQQWIWPVSFLACG